MWTPCNNGSFIKKNMFPLSSQNFFFTFLKSHLKDIENLTISAFKQVMH